MVIASDNPVDFLVLCPILIPEHSCFSSFQLADWAQIFGSNDTHIQQELTFGWPFDPWQRKAASMQLTSVLEAVDLDHISVKTPLSELSDGYKRR